MSPNRSSIDRRKFVQLAALGAVPAACLGSPQPSDAAEAKPELATSSLPSSVKSDGSGVRAATIQTTRNSYVKGLKTNPFGENFSKKDLQKSVDGWLKWYEELIGRAGSNDCKLVVLTEDMTRLSSVMTYLDDRSVFTDTVAWQTERVAERMGNAARKNSTYVVACYFANDEGTIYNVADLFGPQGDLVGRYRKVHLPEYELWQVSAGNEFPAFETDLGWISMLICYDQMWPESASCCAMNGAQIICQPSAASLKDYHMKTRAMDNQVHFISSTSRNSMIVSPKAEILANAETNNPEIAWADLDLETGTQPADDLFWEHLYSGIKDHKERVLRFRRPDAYSALIQEEPPLVQQYPNSEVANTPELINRVYQIHKAVRVAQAAGKPSPFKYHWKY